MALIGNVIWFIFGGEILALSWLLASLFCCVTIVLIPVVPMCWRFALFSAAPFGREAIDKRYLDGPSTAVQKAGSVVGNVLWLLVGGWWLALINVIGGLRCASP